MKAITVWQPHAEQIASGAKMIENRSWYTSHRGPLLIHAGLRCDPDVPGAGLLPRGVFVAVVELADVHVGRDDLGSRCRCSGGGAEWWRDDPIWHWRLVNPRRVANVPARGRQMLWTPGDAVMAALSLPLPNEPAHPSVAVRATRETPGGA